ncbi:uncharacterized protein GGS25DRAFT_492130 [Hypoxylon fragiforme]|uniref:uncharacterized protein n=1 Tax=Hypoxylon fragiforme TaxID=63214 RepID=UPI0020C70D58|nr:uncharacterized protein GGS25DRAFT_492130 [Hypoxylon fragiforme]KAI2608917.1 hypothetical protein GGS25DRAFT_492130 [Hypoxylon fragiforme]
MLCTRVITDLEANFPHFPLAYYFFSSQSESRADPFIVVRSWISQIILKKERHGEAKHTCAFNLARERWENTDGRPASQAEIMELFAAIAQSTPNCVFIVDGLDECTGTRYSLEEFMASLKQAVSNSKSRLIIFSRNESDIRNGLRVEVSSNAWDLIEYCISPDDVKPDATLFSHSIVNRQLQNKDKSDREYLADRMADRFDSMFLCIKMLEEQLRGGKNVRQLQKVVEQAPTNLANLYDHSWARIMKLPDADRIRAMAIIRWATFALRPMTVREITGALLLADVECDDISERLPDAIDKEYIATEILGLCASLVETRGPNSDFGLLTVHLTHFSVRD